jgi:hypothetical protein
MTLDRYRRETEGVTRKKGLKQMSKRADRVERGGGGDLREDWGERLCSFIAATVGPAGCALLHRIVVFELKAKRSNHRGAR